MWSARKTQESCHSIVFRWCFHLMVSVTIPASLNCRDFAISRSLSLPDVVSPPSKSAG